MPPCTTTKLILVWEDTTSNTPQKQISQKYLQNNTDQLIKTSNRRTFTYKESDVPKAELCLCTIYIKTELRSKKSLKEGKQTKQINIRIDKMTQERDHTPKHPQI